MHMVTLDPRVLNGRAIKIIYIIHVEWPLLFTSMDNSCHGCFAAQNLTERTTDKDRKITLQLVRGRILYWKNKVAPRCLFKLIRMN